MREWSLLAVYEVWTSYVCCYYDNCAVSDVSSGRSADVPPSGHSECSRASVAGGRKIAGAAECEVYDVAVHD